MSSNFQVSNQSLVFRAILWALFVGILVALIDGALGSQKAVVSAPSAVIFADMELSAPIGTLKQGKEIRVGSVARKNGTVLPVIVMGKVTYIQVKDVELQEFKVDSSKKLAEHKYFNVSGQKVEDNLSDNNHLSLSMHKFASGDDWDKFSRELGQSSGEDVTGYLLMFEHRSPETKYHWGGGLGFYSISEQNFYFKTLTVEFQMHYIPISTALITIDLGGGVLFSGDARVKVSGASSEARGSLFGYQLSAQAKIFPYSKISFLAGMEIRKMSFNGLDKISTDNGTQTKEIKSMGGFGIYAGISYGF